MVDQPVDGGDGHDGIGEDLIPGTEGLVGGDDQAAALVAVGDELEEHLGLGVDFPYAEYERMAQLARDVDGAMLISLNDHPDIRRVFAGLHMEAVELRYTVGGGAGREARELIIWNARCEYGRRQGEHGQRF